MHCRTPILTVALVATLTFTGTAQAHDETKYPNLKGQWDRFVVGGLIGQPSFDQTKGWGDLQQAPLTPEYQAIFEANVRAADWAQAPTMPAALQPACLS